MGFRPLMLALALTVVSSTAAAGDVWEEESGKGFMAMGTMMGSHGGNFTQEQRFKFHLGEHYAITVSGLFMHALGSDPYRFDLGGKLGFQGGTDVVANFARAYGGGGVFIMQPLSGVDDLPDEDEIRIGFGGHFGLELFMGPWISAFIEVGGGGALSTSYGAGATVMSGFMLYTFP